jgi:hypothetical protein
VAYARWGAEYNFCSHLHRAHKIINAQHTLLKDRAANMTTKNWGCCDQCRLPTQADV